MPESKGRRYNYEGFFLVSQAAAADLSACVEHLTETIGRGQGELIALRKWDERRLAYEINNHKRGVYFLAYFNADPAFMTDVERLSNLSETIERFIFTRADHLSMDEMQAHNQIAQLNDEAKLRKDDGGGESKGEGDNAEANAEPASADA
jgi:small subunit ribosomal protein S6